MTKKHQLLLALGSNLGNREELLREAVAEIAEQIGEVTSLSALYETAPWGFESPHPFLNAAVAVTTSLSPQEILLTTQAIERTLGRTQKSSGGGYADRPIDIDLLLYDNLVEQTPTLTLPHPLMHLRSFVMKPVAEIAPEWVHPILGKSMVELLCEL